MCFLQQSQGSDCSGGLTTVECCDCTADLVQVCWSCCSWVQGGSPGRIVLVDFCSSILVFNRWWLYRMLLVLGFLNSWQGTLVLGPFQNRTAPQKSRASGSCALDSGCLPGCPTIAPPLLISHCFMRIVFYPLTGEVLLVFCVTVLTVGGVKSWSKAAALLLMPVCMGSCGRISCTHHLSVPFFRPPSLPVCPSVRLSGQSHFVTLIIFIPYHWGLFYWNSFSVFNISTK